MSDPFEQDALNHARTITADDVNDRVVCRERYSYERVCELVPHEMDTCALLDPEPGTPLAEVPLPDRTWVVYQHITRYGHLYKYVGDVRAKCEWYIDRATGPHDELAECMLDILLNGIPEDDDE